MRLHRAFSAILIAGCALPVMCLAQEGDFPIKRTLSIGSRGEDVAALQRFLANEAGVYPEGLVTGFFGKATEAAVKRFQANEGIVSSGDGGSTGFGVVGPLTRAALSKSANEANVGGGGPPQGSFNPAPAMSDSGAWLVDATRNLQPNVPPPSSANLGESDAVIKRLQDALKSLQVQLTTLQAQVAQQSATGGGSISPSATKPTSIMAPVGDVSCPSGYGWCQAGPAGYGCALLNEANTCPIVR